MAFLTGIAKSGASALGGGRFTLVNILPGTLLAVFVFVLYRSHAFVIDRPVSLSAVLPGKDDTDATIAFVFGTFLLGVLLRPFQVALVQMLEGYAQPRLLRYLRALAIERHRRIKDTAEIRGRILGGVFEQPAETLRAAAIHAKIAQRREQLSMRVDKVLDGYPDSDELIMPTRLGNVLRQGEEAAGRPYGLEAMHIYPRMYPSVSELLRGDISRQLDLIATTASLCVAFLAATVISLPLALRPDVWRITPAVVLLFAAVSYRGAVRASADHALLLATAIDLHRFDMIKALHLRLPETARDELRMNRELTDFFRDRAERLTDYPDLASRAFVHPDAASPPPTVEVVISTEEPQPDASSRPDEGASAGPDEDKRPTEP